MSAAAILLRLLAATDSLAALADPAPTLASSNSRADGSQAIAEDREYGVIAGLPPAWRKAAVTGTRERTPPERIA